MKYFRALVIVVLLSGCAQKPTGEWVEILNNEKWYQEYNAPEKNYIGVVYDKGEGKWAQTKEEYNRYFLELWYATYQIHSPVDNSINLQEFVGKKVEIVGKEKEFVYGGRAVKKILVGRVRRV